MLTYQPGHDFSSGSRLQYAGHFHFVVNSVNYPPVKNDGSPLPNGFLQLQTTVAAGTAPGCEDKQWELILWHPKPDNPDYGQRINDRALIALSVIDPREPGKPIDFDPDALIGRQFVAHVEENVYNGKTSYRLAYADIFHVDDPEVAAIPKSDAMLAILPPEQRRIGSVAKTGAKASPPKPATTAPAVNNSLDDI